MSRILLVEDDTMITSGILYNRQRQAKAWEADAL